MLEKKSPSKLAHGPTSFAEFNRDLHTNLGHFSGPGNACDPYKRTGPKYLGSIILPWTMANTTRESPTP